MCALLTCSRAHPLPYFLSPASLNEQPRPLSHLSAAACTVAQTGQNAAENRVCLIFDFSNTHPAVINDGTSLRDGIGGEAAAAPRRHPSPRDRSLHLPTAGRSSASRTQLSKSSSEEAGFRCLTLTPGPSQRLSPHSLVFGDI